MSGILLSQTVKEVVERMTQVEGLELKILGLQDQVDWWSGEYATASQIALAQKMKIAQAREILENVFITPGDDLAAIKAALAALK